MAKVLRSVGKAKYVYVFQLARLSVLLWQALLSHPLQRFMLDKLVCRNLNVPFLGIVSESRFNVYVIIPYPLHVIVTPWLV